MNQKTNELSRKSIRKDLWHYGMSFKHFLSNEIPISSRHYVMLLDQNPYLVRRIRKSKFYFMIDYSNEEN